MSVVRISKASFQSEDLARMQVLWDESQATLVPEIENLQGCLHYWAGIDPVSSTMVNVSVWETLADAKQMQTLAPMRTLAEEFTKLGVVFVRVASALPNRPICNYETLWKI